jgi:hypothetical protein
MSNYLTRDDLTLPDPPRFAEFDLPNGKKCRIRNLSEREKTLFEHSILSPSTGKVVGSKLDNMRARLIALCVVDAAGGRVLRDDDVRYLQDKDGAVMAKIYDECRKHCGFEEHDLEQLVKNSDATSIDASPSASPTN